MTLLTFIIGLLIILGIARYNESDKLFWMLFVSYVGGFAATTAVCEYISSKNKDKVEVVSPTPTQVLYGGSHRFCVLADPTNTVTNEEKSSDPVSKDSVKTKQDFVLSKVCAPARDQPTMPFDTS